MANKIKIKRGLAANLPTLDTGEPGFTTDTHKLYIGNGGTNVLINSDSGGGGGTEPDANGNVLIGGTVGDGSSGNIVIGADSEASAVGAAGNVVLGGVAHKNFSTSVGSGAETQWGIAIGQAAVESVATDHEEEAAIAIGRMAQASGKQSVVIGNIGSSGYNANDNGFSRAFVKGSSSFARRDGEEVRMICTDADVGPDGNAAIMNLSKVTWVGNSIISSDGQEIFLNNIDLNGVMSDLVNCATTIAIKARMFLRSSNGGYAVVQEKQYILDLTNMFGTNQLIEGSSNSDASKRDIVVADPTGTSYTGDQTFNLEFDDSGTTALRCKIYGVNGETVNVIVEADFMEIGLF